MNSDNIKISAILALGIIGGLPLYRYIDRISDPSSEEMYIVIGCVIAIVLVLLSDRLTSLKVSKDKLELQLSEIKREVRETARDFKENTSGVDSERIEKIEKKTSQEQQSDLIQEAEEIGSAMAMLREVISSYKKNKTPEQGTAHHGGKPPRES